jgi:predicted secreted Zn-dependent protease
MPDVSVIPSESSARRMDTNPILPTCKALVDGVRRGADLVARFARLALAMGLAACSRAATPTADGVGSVGAIPPGVQLASRYVEYEVSARSIQELQDEMRRAGPSVDGRRFAAATTGEYRWRWQYDRRGSSCTMRDVRVDVDARVEMPRRAADEPLDATVAEWWNAYLSRLREHEQGHVRLAVAGAREIVDALRPLGSGSCDELGVSAEGHARRLLERARERQALYDRDTRHGALPAAFPTVRTP